MIKERKTMKTQSQNYIKDGHPHSCGFMSDVEEGIDDALLQDLPDYEQSIVLEWIENAFIPGKCFNHKHTSYGLKHILHGDTNIYLSNNQFKDAMLIMGYKPKDESELNWIFNISHNSPLFRRKRKKGGN